MIARVMLPRSVMLLRDTYIFRYSYFNYHVMFRLILSIA